MQNQNLASHKTFD